MKPALVRPQPILSPRRGLMLKDQFQVAYVTNDMDYACDTFARQFGIHSFSFIEGPMPTGGKIKVAFAWAGSTMYEIIAAKGPGTDFYTRMLPNEGPSIRIHHLGFLLHDQDSWRSLQQELSESDRPIVYETHTGSFIDAYYIEAPELGHYLEYIYPYQAGKDFFASIPVNS